MYYKLFISLALLLLPISTYSQIEEDIIRPSANAQQFGIAAKAETALSKGQVSLNIPLMELKGKGYDLPISISFYSGDITTTTEASSIGLGWGLMAGGVITKIIKGTEDNWSASSETEHHFNRNYIRENFENWSTRNYFMDNIKADLMPDEYTYSLPGHNGAIEITADGVTINKKLFPDESYKIEDLEHGYCITADDGTKFFFQDYEEVTVEEDEYENTSWFLTRIETTKGGTFSFAYEDEEHVDYASGEYEANFHVYFTKRIVSITSEFGTVYFHSTMRDDQGSISSTYITDDKRPRRINRIELRDENDEFVKGYELDNAGCFVNWPEYEHNSYCNYRHKLSSITQYDALGNHLPPYEFEYSYKFYSSKIAHLVGYYNDSNGNELPRNSWTSSIGPQAYVNINLNGDPLCYMVYPNTPYTALVGMEIISEGSAPTAKDYFWLSSINYPTGATEEFYYENHHYSNVNLTRVTGSLADRIQGKRLAKKILYGTEITKQTEYVYSIHDANYNVVGPSSGVMTNPSIHCATLYTLADIDGTRGFRASRITSGKAFNSYMGTPVSYTEVEEIEKDMDDNILGRTIHYFYPRKISAPVNYIFVNTNNVYSPSLTEIDNHIYGTKSNYSNRMSGYNNMNLTYLAYPVGEFCDIFFNAEQPIKDVFIGKDGKVMKITEYSYHVGPELCKYGYRVKSQDHRPSENSNVDYTIHWISMSEYITRRFRNNGFSTTTFYYDGNACDSIVEGQGIGYNKGRIYFTSCYRDNDLKITRSFFPDDITNTSNNCSSPKVEAINELLNKNIIADPVKTIVKRNNVIIGGECKDYQLHSGMPLLNSLYKIKNTNSNYDRAPAINSNGIDYSAELYKEGEILTYDENHNPTHIRTSGDQDKIYVWGYNGRFPVAIIENMDYDTFYADSYLRYLLGRLSQYRKIDSETVCQNLRTTNTVIRLQLPPDAHITTFTYDPYYGITSELDDSNLGTIYTYDTFGRLSAKYDENYKKQEEYDYHFRLQ